MYRVIYEIDIEAESPRKAAQQVAAIFKDEDSCPPIFDVIPWDGADYPHPNSCDLPGCTSVEMED